MFNVNWTGTSAEYTIIPVCLRGSATSGTAGVDFAVDGSYDNSPASSPFTQTITTLNDDSYVLSGFVENASDILWITAGDGNFDDPTLIDATYTPGEGDIFMGGVELTLTANASAPCNGIYVDDMFLTIEVCGYVSGNLFDNVDFKIAPNPDD